jgi:DNA (cytosine-5)-methyltransferase 1
VVRAVHPVRDPAPHRGAERAGPRLAGLFAGIGGLERGFSEAGFRPVLFSEIDPAATDVLAHQFPTIPCVGDVRDLAGLPSVDVVAGGFPCQDLSQAGRTAGIRGTRSSLVGEVFRLLASSDPTWLVLENVPFMLALEGGRAMRYLAGHLEGLGFEWAYRVIDARAFGIPQRRRRVLLLASRTRDPRPVLLGEDVGAAAEPSGGSAFGFYWTEGLRGLGWAVDAVPTLKGGSTVGIPSPPAIWLGSGDVVTPDIRDAERLQGFPPDWTRPACGPGSGRREGERWRLVGNAVCVPVAAWLAERMAGSPETDAPRYEPLRAAQRWPEAACSWRGSRFRACVSAWPRRRPLVPIGRFLRHRARPLSARATAGFLERARRSRLRFQPGFLEAVDRHLERVSWALGQG